MIKNICESPEALVEFVEAVRTNARYAKWLTVVLEWAGNNNIDCVPVENDGWCARVSLSDANGQFFDYAEPINAKKGEDDSSYSERVQKCLSKFCLKMRKDRFVERNGRMAFAGRVAA